MPGINVIDSDGDLQRFPDATTWHVDDRGQLHLKSGAGAVASFAKDCWQGASTDDETGPGVKRTTLDDVVRELREIRGALDSVTRQLDVNVNRVARKVDLTESILAAVRAGADDV